jgi:hypothetical protein
MEGVAKVFVMAVVIDVVYQYIVFRWFYPGEALFVAFILAFVPYLLIRGPVNRIVRTSMTQREKCDANVRATRPPTLVTRASST